MNDTINVLGTQIPVAVFLVFLHDWLKKQSWFPMLSYEADKANRIFSIVATGLATIGVHMTINRANHELMITWPTTAVLVTGIWHWVNQYVITKASYLMLQSKLVPANGNGTAKKSPISDAGATTVKTAVLLLCASLALGSTGCRHKVDTTNPVVIKAVTLQDAEKIVNTISAGVKAADHVVDTTKSTDPEYYAAVSPKLTAIARLNEVGNQCIVNAVKGGLCDWKTAILNIAAAIPANPDTLTAFGFKSPKTQQAVTVGFNVFIQGLNMALKFQQQVTNGG